MLQQILKDMYIDPDVLEALNEDQKKTLFLKMRQEQVRRWKEREEKEGDHRPKPKTGTSKNVSWLLGRDGDVAVMVIGEVDELKTSKLICSGSAERKSPTLHDNASHQITPLKSNLVDRVGSEPFRTGRENLPTKTQPWIHLNVKENGEELRTLPPLEVSQKDNDQLALEEQVGLNKELEVEAPEETPVLLSYRPHPKVGPSTLSLIPKTVTSPPVSSSSLSRISSSSPPPVSSSSPPPVSSSSPPPISSSSPPPVSSSSQTPFSSSKNLIRDTLEKSSAKASKKAITPTPVEPPPSVPKTVPMTPVDSPPSVPKTVPMTPVDSPPSVPKTVPMTPVEPPPSVPKTVPMTPVEPPPSVPKTVPMTPVEPPPSVPKTVPMTPVDSPPSVPKTVPMTPVDSPPSVPKTVPMTPVEPPPSVPKTVPMTPVEPPPSVPKTSKPSPLPSTIALSPTPRTTSPILSRVQTPPPPIATSFQTPSFSRSPVPSIYTPAPFHRAIGASSVARGTAIRESLKNTAKTHSPEKVDVTPLSGTSRLHPQEPAEAQPQETPSSRDIRVTAASRRAMSEDVLSEGGVDTLTGRGRVAQLMKTFSVKSPPTPVQSPPPRGNKPPIPSKPCHLRLTPSPSLR
ncbi:proteoglycan 4 isoform X2 [Esox lucius]|uniref:SH2 domain-containing protein n=1 Tax=Esox lucius TaxID=8010 RepID=A0A3P9AKQ4_ESOLU|nr:proteoglycan 4 isoform X2 [Esox lucius]